MFYFKKIIVTVQRLIWSGAHCSAPAAFYDLVSQTLNPTCDCELSTGSILLGFVITKPYVYGTALAVSTQFSDCSNAQPLCFFKPQALGYYEAMSIFSRFLRPYMEICTRRLGAIYSPNFLFELSLDYQSANNLETYY